MATSNSEGDNMPDPCSILKAEETHVPDWLAEYHTDMPFPRNQFFASRIVYYPGSAADGHPLRIFGGPHAAHCFVFSDYGESATYFEEQLRDEDHIGHPKGYRPLQVISLDESQLTPNGWQRHVTLRHTNNSFANTRPPEGPFALWAVLERKESFGDDHGPSRLAILVVGGDGVATFDALFCQPDGTPPYAVVLQDHGFGGNWTTFGGDGSPLWSLARRGTIPKWLLVADNTTPWPGYKVVSNADCGGMHASPRRLFCKDVSHA
jgi:hypothetical protein